MGNALFMNGINPDDKGKITLKDKGPVISRPDHGEHKGAGLNSENGTFTTQLISRLINRDRETLDIKA
jgi:hypothetical protein